jgi:uncharacterized membrane protein YhaH (DUF805 family)
MYWYLEAMGKYAVFSGRARRKEYWMFQLVNAIVLVVLFAGIFAQRHSPMRFFFLLAMCGYALATILPGLAVSVRRLHDINFSGFWILISLIPMGGLVLLVFHVLDSTPGTNQYGPNPKAGQSAYGAQYGSYGTRPMARAASAGAGEGAASPDNQWLVASCKHCGAPMRATAQFCAKCGQAAY